MDCRLNAENHTAQHCMGGERGQACVEGFLPASFRLNACMWNCAKGTLNLPYGAERGAGWNRRARPGRSGAGVGFCGSLASL